MPIRQRGKTWQVDVRLADGTRFRRSYPTEAIAKEAEKALTPNPQQRAMNRFAARGLRSKSSSIVRSGKPSCDDAAHSMPAKSHKPTSRKSVRTLQKKLKR
jgi:hypothetical protein